MMKHKAIYQRYLLLAALPAYLLLAALPAFLLASCSQEETTGGQDMQNGEIRFEIGFAPQTGAVQTDAQTRVATDTKFNSTWEDGDAIGIYAVEHGQPLAASGNPIHNVKMTYNTSGGAKWSGQAYWPTGGRKLDFYAYYPYNANATDPMDIGFSVHTDQSAATGAKSNYNLSDLLTARNTNADGYGKGETVQLSFKHALAMVQVNVSSSMVGNYPADALNVWLNGCTTNGVFNLSTQSVTPPANPASPVKIKMYPCPNDGTPGIYAYRALVPKQTIAASTALFRFEYNGSTLLRSEPLAEPLSLKAGGAETFDRTFPFTSATVSSDVRLNGLFTEKELAAITHLKVMGEMTEADFTTIKAKMTSLKSLDLGGATVVGNIIIDPSHSNNVNGNAIPFEAFINKTSLKEFVFPQNISTIGGSAFRGCSGLTGTLTIPSGVTTIGESAFQGCIGFTGTLTIPYGVTTIGESAFQGCSGFTGILTIPSSVTTISGFAFYKCSGFTGPLTIPSGVTTIGDYAFDGCSGFTGTLTIPSGVTTISGAAFQGCSGLTALSLPEGLKTIDHNAFNGCSGLTALSLPAGVTTIGASFAGCTKLGSITCHIPDLEKVTCDKDAFNDTPSNIPVFVPAAAVPAYKAHAAWSKFGDMIQPIPNNNK